MSDQEDMHWFNHDGGPLILLPRESLPFWKGIELPSGGRIVMAIFRWENQEIATDYDRACDISEWAEVAPVGPDSWGMVLREDACAVSLLAFEERSDTFAIAQSFLEDADTLSEYRNAFLEAARDQNAWTQQHDTLQIREGEVLLIHAASSGNDVNEIPWNQTANQFNAQVLRVDSGTYRVDEYIPDGNDQVALFTSFQRCGP